jgi:hypothetical protein
MPRCSSTVVVLALSAAALLVSGCQTSPSSSGPRAVTPATGAEKAALIDRVKQLDGEWTMTDDKGQTVTGCTFKTTSKGSAVREIMFPGSDHEMTNLYHMDGPTLVLTHYCAVGNQPRMRAVAGSPGRIDFKFDNVTNWTGASQTYMGQMSIELVDADHIIEHWYHIKDGKTADPVSFELTRKR